MAQYYNVVAGSVPLMVEEMQQICEGQGIQLVVEDINNCTNGGQQFLTYTTAPQHHESGLYPQRTIVGSQLTGVQMDQRQNVYIINTTNDLPVQQGGLKTDVVHTNLANDGIVNIVNDRGVQYVIAGGKLPLNSIHEVQQQPQQQQQQIQWINMPENNSNYEASMKPAIPTNKLVTTVRTPQQRTASSLTLQTQGQCSGTAVTSPQYVGAGPSDKKGPRSYKNKGRGGVTGGGPTRQSLLTVDGISPVKNIITPRGKNSPKLQPQQQITQMPLTPPQSLSGDSTGIERTPINSNPTNNRTPSSVGNNIGSGFRGKTFGTPGPNATGQNVNSRALQTPTRPVISSKIPDNVGQMRTPSSSTSQVMKSLPALHYPAMDSLSERIKKAKLQKVMPAVATTNPLSPSVNVPSCPTARPPLHSGQPRQNPSLIQRATTTTNPTSPAVLNPRGNTQTANQIAINDKSSSTQQQQQQQQMTAMQVQAQRRQSAKTQQQSLSQDSRNVLEIIKKQTSMPCQQKYQREPATTITTTTMTSTTQTTVATSPAAITSSSTQSDNDERMEIDSVTSECTVESDSVNNHEQHESANEEHDGSSASFAYLQKVIENPQTTIVQKQIAGNTVKMLVVLQNGEQRLITFDIPNEPCTVQDLLEQANISFGEETCVSLVSDRILGINYIVEGGAHMGAHCQEGSESGDPYQFPENPITPPDSSSPNFATADENSNSSVTPNEEPKFIDGKLAVCPNCGIGSLDFNRCSRCQKKLPDNVKSILMTPDTQAKKETMISIDSFYKKTNEQNASSKLDAAMGKKRTGRGGRRPAAKTRPVKEPECLTISSDEEDGNGMPRKSDSNMSSVSSSTGGGSNTGNDEPDTILEKEPVITNSTMSTERTVDSEGGIKGGGSREEHIEDGSIQRPHTSLVCRTVRIGSYKYVPRERIIISQSGVRFAVPLLEDDKSFVNLDVKFKEIVKVLIHFGKMMPVLFFYTSTNAGAMIREVLGMQDPKGPYYDPAGKDHTHKRITLLPEKLSEEAKVILKGLFMPNDVLCEINPKEANDILVRASPKDVVQNIQTQSLGGLGRRQSQSTAVTNNNGNGGGIQIMTVYPPPPAKGGIAINTEDYICLGEDQFLNDAIIDFYLRYLMSELLSQNDQNRTHVFSSYFYKRLTSPHTQAGESPATLTPAARRHARVQKWTKNVNIFEKDFIIIPINEHAHWFLAIICYPGLVGKVIAAPQPPKESSSQKTGQKNKKTKEMKLQALTIGSTTITPVTTTITIDQLDEGSERDEAEGDDEEMEMDSDDDEEMENQEDEVVSPPFSPMSPEASQRDIVKIPCILIFDSLAGASRSRVVATLRDYLSCEHGAKVGTEKVFSKDTIKGSSPKVPQQSNFTDCGLYLLQYVESFFKSPIRNYVLPIKSLKNWFEEIVVTRKREELAKLLVRLMNKTKGDKTISLPVVQFPTHDGKMRPKSETPAELKSPKIEAEIKKKPMQPTTPQSASCTDDKTRLVALSTSSSLTTATENVGEKPEVVTRTTTVYQIIPCNSSMSLSSGESPQETLFDAKPRTTSGTLSYLRNKRIPRLMTRDQDGQENQATSAKKHKGDNNESLTRTMSVNSGSSAGSPIVTTAKAVTSYDSCK